MAQSDGQWGETAWGDTDTVKDVEAGVVVIENRVLIITQNNIIPVGDE